VPTVRIIGPGRAGLSLAGALEAVGWRVPEVLGRHDDVRGAAHGVDAVVIATPDTAIAPTASSIEPAGAAVLHLSGSRGLEVLAGQPRPAALHPLVPLPTPAIGARRLRRGVTFAVAGDPVAAEMAEALGGRPVAVADADRLSYHTAACIAANHVVALLGQVERVAAKAGLPLDAFLDLARAAVEDAGRLGPAAALTGPAVRGDLETLDRHLGALDPDERAGYTAGVALALRLAGSADQDPAVPATVSV
jgi:predicted short-subunit dehydrogenase-like oxidoreductase (DUF2520 family)